MTLEKIIDQAQRVLRIESEAIESTSKKLGLEFYNAVKLLLEIEGRGRVIVIGMGKSGHIGNKIAATLASTGTPAFAVHPAEAGHGDLGMLTSTDVVIGISQSGKSDELLQLIPYIKRHAIPMIAMTGSKDTLLSENADITIDTSVEEEACPLGLAPTASTTLTLALGDALAVCLLSAKGFTKDDFAETHPNGLLGRKLLIKVTDAMSELNEVAVVEAGNTIKDSLPIIANGQMGFAVVCDENLMPIGVFTDGDLRRCLDADINIKEIEIEKYMSKKFHSIVMDSLAVKAVDLMEKNSIAALPVVDDEGKLLGAISMKQLLSAGVL